MSEEGIPTPEKNSHTGLIVAIVLVVIVVLLALFFGLYFGLRNKGDDIPDEVNPDPEIVEPGPEDPDSTGEDTPEHSEHSWVWEHDEEGHWQVCTVCGETTTKENHELTYTEQDSEYHIATCDICGYEITEAHTFDGYISDGAGGHHQVCTECAYTTSDETHDLSYVSDNDETHHQECTECDYTTDSVNHNYEIVANSYTESGHTVKCSDCEHETTQAHTFTEVVTSPTCTDGGYTTYTCECGYSYTGNETDALGHSWGDWTDNNDETHIRTCSRCNDTETQDHDYPDTYSRIEVKDTKYITYVYICETCGHVKEVDEEHTFAFATDSWEVIDAVAASGLANQIYTVGDTKTINVGEEYHDIRIIDFNHDTLTTNSDSSYNNDSGKAGITCEMVDILNTTHTMTSSNQSSNSGGWAQCQIRSYLSSDILSTLESDLQSVIKKVNKKSTVGGGASALPATNTTTSSDSLFLLAYTEVSNNTGDGYKDEGTQYAYYSTHSEDSDRIKNLNGTATSWWTRSPQTTGSSAFYFVATSGILSASSRDQYPSYGVSFAFCI